MSRLRPPCETCGHIHIAADARVRWPAPGQPVVYRADYPDSPTRPTREQAIQDMCDYRVTREAKP